MRFGDYLYFFMESPICSYFPLYFLHHIYQFDLWYWGGGGAGRGSACGGVKERGVREKKMNGKKVEEERVEEITCEAKKGKKKGKGLIKEIE